ncbi:MAG TPA: hypothetical protein VKM94_18615 [Blastocatellia bacterium]|nr:hypothetical protein [Blastocatellia bacterium]
MVKAYSRWPLDVVNLGRFDLNFAQRLFVREGLSERKTEWPVLRNMIAANGVFESGVEPPPPFIVKEVTGRRITTNGGKLRIAFIGLAAPIRVAEGIDGAVTDVFAAARKVVPQARKQADLVVIVAHCEWAAANRLAQENPEADIVMSGNAEGFFDPAKVGNALVVPVAPGNLRMGELRIYLDKQGKASFKFRATDLDQVVPSDPAAVEFVDSARRERAR